MFSRGGIQTRVIALAAVLAMVVVTPAGAAGWGDWGAAREWTDALLPRALSWLGLTPVPSIALKCDHGSSPDPNGCPKRVHQEDSQVRPARASRMEGAYWRAGGGWRAH
jgi:hypothetical protein